MAILPIRTLPDSCLKTPSRPVEQFTPQVARLIHDLIETMRRHPRCVGLAAPQVGVNLRVAVVDVTGHPKAEGILRPAASGLPRRPPAGVPASVAGLMVFVNPAITAQDGELVQREGCLSIPDFTGNVPRAAAVQVKAMDAQGRWWARRLEGFEAIAAQHELDHLDGTLFLDRVTNLRTDVFRRKTYWLPTKGSDPVS
ncbi:MAG: peptide deformylase [Candidatus Omnitrophica bacterium]|nr:peptide deformylase [Candidatus Omnitrophota bacterium]